MNEAPAIIKRDNKIFMTYSASATGECYCMGMLSIDVDKDPLDPKNGLKRRMQYFQAMPKGAFWSGA